MSKFQIFLPHGAMAPGVGWSGLNDEQITVNKTVFLIKTFHRGAV